MAKLAADVVKGIAEELIPPDDDAPLKEKRRWMWTIVVLTVMNSVALAMHIALACGLTPFYAGFAQAEELKKNTEQLQAMQLSSIVQAIPSTKRKLCTAQTTELRQVYWEQLNRLLDQYQEIQKRPFPPLTCEDVKE